jgi:hypothetical protein
LRGRGKLINETDLIQKPAFPNIRRVKCNEGARQRAWKRSGLCQTLNLTASTCDNLIWLLLSCKLYCAKLSSQLLTSPARLATVCAPVPSECLIFIYCTKPISSPRANILQMTASAARSICTTMAALTAAGVLPLSGGSSRSPCRLRPSSSGVKRSAQGLVSPDVVILAGPSPRVVLDNAGLCSAIA